MNRYTFDIEKFNRLIPSTLRKNRLVLLLCRLLRPLKYLHGLFIEFKNKIQKRWEYSGQVFSLQKAIREYCGNNNCCITDGEYHKELFIPYDGDERLANYQVDITYDYSDKSQVNVLYAGFLQVEQHDFIVHIPAELEGKIDEIGLCTLIDSYKIAGKFYKIIYE